MDTPKQDERVNAYIAKTADFAKPILSHMREVIQKASPELQEDVKWGCPVFMYKGEMICMLAAFKGHCSLGFWKQALIDDTDEIFKPGDKSAGSIGQIKTMADLPKDAIIKKYVKAAMKLNDDGVKSVRAKPKEKVKNELETPEYFTKALKRNKAAEKVFNAFSYSNKKEYISWFEEAKTDTTRDKRIAEAVEWIAEGKTRLWKYQKS